MDVFLHLSSGAGPRECEWVVVNLATRFQEEAATEGLRADILWDGDPAACASSLLMKLSGANAETFARARTGTVKWIGQSPFRPHHKRKNWYVAVNEAPRLEDVPALEERDIRFDAMRASGPGGQHVNTTASAVRATHGPTGLSTVVRDERSQHANKKIAVMKLAIMFADRKAAETAKAKRATWRQHHALERGNECRTYTGAKFKPQ